jgi:hypothetical protein
LQKYREGGKGRERETNNWDKYREGKRDLKGEREIEREREKEREMRDFLK